MSRNPLDLLQQAYYIGIGALTTAVESLQDEAKRQQNMSQLRLEIQQLAQLWADKGRMTEAEARKLIEALFSQQKTTAATPMANSPEAKSIEADIRALIDTLRAIRQDLEQERQPSQG